MVTWPFESVASSSALTAADVVTVTFGFQLTSEPDASISPMSFWLVPAIVVKFPPTYTIVLPPESLAVASA